MGPVNPEDALTRFTAKETLSSAKLTRGEIICFQFMIKYLTDFTEHEGRHNHGKSVKTVKSRVDSVRLIQTVFTVLRERGSV